MDSSYVNLPVLTNKEHAGQLRDSHETVMVHLKSTRLCRFI